MGGSQPLSAHASEGVAERFIEERERMGYSRAELAYATGYSAEQIRKVERGERMPGAELLAALLKLRGNVEYVLLGAGATGKVAEASARFPSADELADARRREEIRIEAMQWKRLRADRRKKVLTEDEADLVDGYRDLDDAGRASLLESLGELRRGELPSQARGVSVRADRASIAGGRDVTIGRKRGR